MLQSHLCLGKGRAALVKVAKQPVDELLLVFLAIFPGAAGKVGDVCTILHVLVQRNQ